MLTSASSSSIFSFTPKTLTTPPQQSRFTVRAHSKPPIFPNLKTLAGAAVFAAVALQFPAAAARASPPPPPPLETESLSPLSDLLETNTEALAALKSLLQQKLELGEDDEAFSILKRLIAAQPDAADWKFLAARLAAETGDVEAARGYYQEVLAANPLSFEALFENALLMDRCGEGEAAMRRLEEALRVAEEEKKAKEARDVKLIMAQITFLQKNVDEALGIYNQLTKEDPRDFRPYFCRGMIYSLLDRNEEAKEQFAKYRELSPKKFEVDGVALRWTRLAPSRVRCSNRSNLNFCVVSGSSCRERGTWFAKRDKMMKLAGYSLAVSFAPISSNVVKSNGRFTLGISHRNTCSYRLFSTHAQKQQLQEKPGVVARYYLPPWFSVAPMMDWTDHHYRTLVRLISKHAWLYTEMLAAETIVHQKDNLDRFLAYSPDQHPIVLQIGGSNIENLAKATELANVYCYDEINLNCGCPSPKVAGHGCFGVSLMLNPKFVAEAMSAIAASTNVPVSVKCRIGVDDHDSYNELCDFIYQVSSLSPTKHFIIHSRKALLNGISPAENRSIPPLKYEYFYGLLRDFPDLRFTINGGISRVDEVSAAREAGAHGVMVGRAAYNNPWQILGHVDAAIYDKPSCNLTRRQVLEKYLVYGDSVLGKYGHRSTLRDVVKPLLHLFHSEPGNGLWKRKADAAFKNCTTIESFFEETLVAIPDSVLDSLVAEPPPGRDLFANMHNLLPPPYRTREEAIIICA
ncbi:protein SLOW GREEN 1, chloroplastic [Glycine soja]